MAGYKELKIWQLNQNCIRNVLQLMDNLPDKYAFQHISKQLFRSVSSVGANIAEGHDNYKGREFVRYIDISIRSAIESDHWLSTLQNLGIKSDEIIDDNIEIIKMMKGLKKSILSAVKNSKN